MILGAIIGDTVGSIYEFCNHKSVDFPLFDPCCEFTDDSIVTIAVAKWLVTDKEHTFEKLEELNHEAISVYLSASVIRILWADMAVDI